MSKIKKIYTFGTSFTAGGGYEFDSPAKKATLHKLYGHLNETPTRYNFSWPGQLNKLVKSHDIKVDNYAESGYGNEKMYRNVYDIIQSKNFKKEETLFILEFSGVGRQEIYFNPLQDYVIFNFKDSEPFNTKYSSIAHKYFYDKDDNQSIIDENRKVIEDYHKLVYDQVNREKYCQRNNNFFIRYLESLGINYLIGQHPYFPVTKYNDNTDFSLLDKKSVEFITENKYPHGTCMGLASYYSFEGLDITSETNGEMVDGHAGLLGNKNIAINMFNGLITHGYINDSKKIPLSKDIKFCRTE